MSGRMLGCPECSRSDRETRDGTSWCGSGVLNTDCRWRCRAGCGSWSRSDRPVAKPPAWIAWPSRGRHEVRVGWLDLLLLTSFFDELLGQLGAFARSHHPADDITTENVED